MKRDVRDYLEDILNECDYLIKKSKVIKYNEFIINEDLKRAFVRSLEVIGEASKKISHYIREKCPNVNWRDIAGMRDKLIHEYFGVDYEVVWKTITEDVPSLSAEVSRILDLEAKND